MTPKVKLAIAAATAAAALTACSGLRMPDPVGLVSRGTNQAADTAVDSAANRAGQRVGDAVGNSFGKAAAARVGASLNPMLTQLYMGLIFSMAFTQGGYAVNEVAYHPGEWTRWTIPNPKPEPDEPKETRLERAYLFDDADGNAWWKVKYVLDPEKADAQTMIVEALFDKKTQTLVRMRAQMPGEKEPKEIPVTEATYYVPPQKLTKQSIEGATKGVVPVTVPAGKFRARHVVFGDAGGGSSEWYLVERVPGGSVRFVHKAANDDGGGDEGGVSESYVMDLVTFGKGAKSELGVARK